MVICLSIFDFSVQTMHEETVSLERYKGKVLLIVNTASKCGFTPQYTDLQKLYDRYRDDGLEILGFPCNQFEQQEPGNNKEIAQFCELNYGVKFPVFAKTDVKGTNANPLFRYLCQEIPFAGFDESQASGRLLHMFLQEKFPETLMDDSIKWNFTKFLVDREGKVVGRFESPVEPVDLETPIKDVL